MPSFVLLNQNTTVIFRVSSLVGIVLLAVLLERGMFFEQFRCKTEILFKQIFMQNSNQNTICTLINLLSQDYSEVSIHGIPGTTNYL